MPTFRVHFTDGHKVDVDAATADAARETEAVKLGGPVSKIKIVKGGS